MQAHTQDIRWKQRFHNFDRAFVLLRSALEERRLAEFNRLEQEGLCRRFEFTYELAWKAAKDYLQEQGVVLDEITPKAVIAPPLLPPESFRTGRCGWICAFIATCFPTAMTKTCSAKCCGRWSNAISPPSARCIRGFSNAGRPISFRSQRSRACIAP